MNPETWMGEALVLAANGRGFVEPNPRVGALALREDAVVGRGFHRHYGGPHAEVEAVLDAEAKGIRPDGIVVTLEPCSSLGKKTPPCTNFLLARGIKRVLVGAEDPDPRHRGRGVKALREAGVRVETGFFADEALAQNRPFLRWLSLDRPWTIGKWAMTLDGKSATRTGEARWISSIASRTLVHQMRSRVDAVVVGMGTVLADDPELTVRGISGQNPVRIVVDPEAGLPVAGKLAAGAQQVPLWVLVSQAADAGRLAGLGVTVIRVPAVESPSGSHRRLDLAEAWRELRRRGISRLLVEGGGKLMGEVLAARCLDQVYAFITPKLVGGKTAPTPVEGEGIERMEHAVELADRFHQWVDGDVLLGGFVV